MNDRLHRTAPILAFLIWLLLTTLAVAQGSSTANTPVLTLDPIPAAVVGDRPVVIAHLMTTAGEPIVDVTLTLFIDGQVESRSRTADNGSAVLLVRSYLPTGVHNLEVSFGGNAALDLTETSVATTLEMRPGSVIVQMVPVMAGVEVRMTSIPEDSEDRNEKGESWTVFSDDDGLAHFDVDETGTYLLELILPWKSPDPGIRAEFSRWMDNEFQPSREITYRKGEVYQAGFEVHYEITYQFTDPQGNPIASDDISSITIKNSIGERIIRETHTPVWVQGSRVTRSAGTLEETRLLYSVEEIIVEGTNVVNRSQLSFIPAESQSWTLPLLYYSMTISSVDAIFGFPIGHSIELISPAGLVRTLPLDSSGEAAISNLPRGEYQVRVLGNGYSPPMPVLLSRDQAVQLKVISIWDGAFVGGLGLSVALGLLAFGRWRSRNEHTSVPSGHPTPTITMKMEATMETSHRQFAKRASPGAPPSLPILAVMMILLVFGSASHVAGAPGADTPTASPDLATPIAMPEGDFADTPVLAYYYIWFNPDSWERAKVDFPLLGRYSSDDTEIMRQHVRWAKDAGIDGFIVSWKNTDILTSRLRLLIDVCAEEDFKLAIIYQGLDVEREPLPAPRIAADLDFFATEFGDHPVFELFDKPLVIWSGTWQFSRDDISLVTTTRRDRLLILASERNPDDVRNIADLVDGDAYYWSSVDPHTFPGYVDKLQAMERAVHERGGIWIAPAAPGFDARLLGGDRIVNREDGEMLRLQMEGAIQSAPDAIGLISWNEFSENSHVEPSCLYQTESLDTLANMLGGTAPPVMPCGVGSEPPGTPTIASAMGESTFSVEDAESTIAVAEESADLPGASTINADTSDTSASPDPPIMRVATVALLVFTAGIVAGSVMIVVMRSRHVHAP